MRSLVYAIVLVFASQTVSAKEFRVDGDVFVVNASVLESTPKWAPATQDIPVTAAQAIKIGTQYHNRQQWEGFAELFKWELSGCTLVRESNQRWYWVVQFRGKFAPHDVARRKHVGGYSYAGPRTRYHRVPILLNGNLAPRIAGSIDPERLPSAIRKVEDKNESQ